jgi:hypothetical protein
MGAQQDILFSQKDAYVQTRLYSGSSSIFCNIGWRRELLRRIAKHPEHIGRQSSRRGHALKCTPEELKGDRDIVLAADKNSLCFVTTRLVGKNRLTLRSAGQTWRGSGPVRPRPAPGGQLDGVTKASERQN